MGNPKEAKMIENRSGAFVRNAYGYPMAPNIVAHYPAANGRGNDCVAFDKTNATHFGRLMLTLRRKFRTGQGCAYP